MKNNNEHFKGIMTILKDLNKKYPNQGLARHIYEATLEYKNLWGMEDKELHFALTKYKAELDLNIINDREVEEILTDGMNLLSGIELGDNIADSVIDDIEWDIKG